METVRYSHQEDAPHDQGANVVEWMIVIQTRIGRAEPHCSSQWNGAEANSILGSTSKEPNEESNAVSPSPCPSNWSVESKLFVLGYLHLMAQITTAHLLRKTASTRQEISTPRNRGRPCRRLCSLLYRCDRQSGRKARNRSSERPSDCLCSRRTRRRGSSWHSCEEQAIP